MICYNVSVESGNGRNAGQPWVDCKQTQTAAMPETEGRLKVQRKAEKRVEWDVFCLFKHLDLVCDRWDWSKKAGFAGWRSNETVNTFCLTA